MAVQIQYRRGSTAQNDAFTGALGEITVDTTNSSLRVHDGVTPGGTAISGGGVQNGTSDVTIPTADGNVEVNVDGNLVAEFFESGVQVLGNTSQAHVWAGNVGAWLDTEGADTEGRLIFGEATVNAAVEVGVVNQSNGTLAYSEFLATNDVGNIDQGWISMGINSSNYDDPSYPITKADGGYLLYQAPEGTSMGGNLVIGTGTNGANNYIVFGAGGFDTGNIQMLIMPDEQVHIEIPTASTSNTTGALRVGGGLGLTGNLYMGGNLVVGADSYLIGNNFQANTHVYSGPVAAWLAAEGETEDGRRIGSVADVPGPAEVFMVNDSSNSLAYGEFIAINDEGNIEQGWIALGINSSTYNDPSYQLTGAGEGYLLFEASVANAGSGNLTIGTGSNGANNCIVFGAGGFATGNTQMVIIPDVQVHIEIPTESTSVTTGALRVAGGLGLTGNLNVGGNVNIAGNITLGGSGNTIDVESLVVNEPIIFLGANNAADLVDLGFVGEYVDGGNKNAGLVRDATDDTFKFWANSTTLPTTTVDFAEANLVYAPVMMGEANVSNSTISTSSTSGALKVGGGAGIAGNLNVGLAATVSGTVTGGNMFTGGTANIATLEVITVANIKSTTGTTSNTAGALVVAGGVGVGGNIYAAGNISGSYFLGNGSQLTGIDTTLISNGNSNVIVSANGNVSVSVAGISNTAVFTSTTLVVGNANITGTTTVTGLTNSGSNGVGNIGSSTTYFNTVFAKATSAQYADLAEKYLADRNYDVGTLLEIGGSAEVTQTTTAASHKIVGVVSDQPAYIMNAGQVDEVGAVATLVALLGRVPCRVKGPVSRGDLLCASDTPGVAQTLQSDQYRPGCVIGKALEPHSGPGLGVIEIIVGRL
jgi:hypothetical protein